MLFVEQVYCSGKVYAPFKLVWGGIAPLFLPPHPIRSPHHLLPTWPVKGLVSFPPIEKICCREHLSGWETAKWHHMWQNLSLHFCTVGGGGGLLFFTPHAWSSASPLAEQYFAGRSKQTLQRSTDFQPVLIVLLGGWGSWLP